MSNALYYGDNLDVLRESIASESVDLVYLDPPFNSNASYNVLFKASSGASSAAQIEAFEDTWHWNESAERAFDAVIVGAYSDASIMVKAMRAALGESDMMAYLAMMAARIVELRRVLKLTGSLYLHCDPTASHYLKLLLDSVFGPTNFRSEVIWKRTTSYNRAKRWGPVHDVILFYSASDSYTWNRTFSDYDQSYLDGKYRHKDSQERRYHLSDLTGPGTRTGDSGAEWRGVNPGSYGRHWEPPHDRALPSWFIFPPGWSALSVRSRLDLIEAADLIQWPKKVDGRPEFRRYLETASGTPIQDVITDIDAINSMAQERLGYPTQKPLALLERILHASSNEGDIVLDPFCGCGTAIHAAEKLGRAWRGIDITHLAVSLVERRLKSAFPSAKYEVYGVPSDIEGARDLANRDKHEFQKWIAGRIGAQPYKGGRKGMDRGIDGYLHFRDAGQQPQSAIVSVKGGSTKSGDVRDLKGTVEREKAAMGLFLTLNEPSREMEREAAAAGFYETGGMNFPRIQILTAAQILDGRMPKVPFGFTEGFKKAARETAGKQPTLGI